MDQAFIVNETAHAVLENLAHLLRAAARGLAEPAGRDAGRAVEARLARMPELRQLSTVSGEFDYLALLGAATPARLDALLDEIGAIEGVNRTQTSVVLARRIDRR